MSIVIPEHAMIGFIGTVVPTGWDDYTAAGGRMVRLNTTPGLYGGSNEHTHVVGASNHGQIGHVHAVSGGDTSYDYGDGPRCDNVKPGTAETNEMAKCTTHQHAALINSQMLNPTGSHSGEVYHDNLPACYAVVLLEATVVQTLIPTNGIVFFVDTAFPVDETWEVLSIADGYGLFAATLGASYVGSFVNSQAQLHGHSRVHSHVSGNHLHSVTISPVVLSAASRAVQSSTHPDPTPLTHIHWCWTEPESVDFSPTTAYLNTITWIPSPGYVRLGAMRAKTNTPLPQKACLLWAYNSPLPTAWSRPAGYETTDRFIRVTATPGEVGQIVTPTQHAHTGTGHDHTSLHNHGGGATTNDAKSPVPSLGHGGTILAETFHHYHTVQVGSTWVQTDVRTITQERTSNDTPLYRTFALMQGPGPEKGVVSILKDGLCEIAHVLSNTLVYQRGVFDVDTPTLADLDESKAIAGSYVNVGAIQILADGARVIHAETGDGLVSLVSSDAGRNW